MVKTVGNRGLIWGNKLEIAKHIPYYLVYLRGFGRATDDEFFDRADARGQVDYIIYLNSL